MKKRKNKIQNNDYDCDLIYCVNFIMDLKSEH